MAFSRRPSLLRGSRFLLSFFLAGALAQTGCSGPSPATSAPDALPGTGGGAGVGAGGQGGVPAGTGGGAGTMMGDAGDPPNPALDGGGSGGSAPLPMTGDDAGGTPGDGGPAPGNDAAADPIPAGTVTGTVQGLAANQSATVLLGNAGFLASRVVTGNQSYRFEGLAAGTYFLKVNAPGHSTGDARTVEVGVAPNALRTFSDVAVASRGPIDFAVEPLPANVSHYEWKEDGTPAGHEEVAHVVAAPKIAFLGEMVALPEVAAADTLVAEYNVILSDEGKPWNQELAYRLLETLRRIPQPARKNEGEKALVPAKFILTDQRIEGDVELSFATGGRTVRLSLDAFVYANPRLVMIDGKRARFYSKRLHHALVRYATRNGSDREAVDKILDERFGCTTQVPDHAALTAPTTREGAASFQDFHPAELVQLINMFEELPDGYHKVPGLKYLVRRKDGHPHPLYAAAPAVAWAFPDAFPNGSYIEFMDSAFSANTDATHRLILHEKSHFLWGYVFSPAIKNEWIALGGWTPNPADPDGWSTSKTTEFVSAYAHKKNPDEDMAESIAYFVLNPAALESRAPAKFAFIRDRVMQGTRYLARIQDDLTFEVLNLYPDYEYPGKIKRVTVTAAGAPEEDKTVTVELALHTAQRVFAGASRAYFRLYSSINTFVDMYVYPVDGDGALLRGQITISKFAKAGLWRPDQIVVTDNVGNQRLEGVNDFGWKLLIDNPLEDVTDPQYVPGTLTVQKFDDTIVENGRTQPVQRIEVRWRDEENKTMQKVYARLANPAAINTYPLEIWGNFDAATSTAIVTFYITDFMRGGDWGVPYLMMVDAANNVGAQAFSSSPQHQPLVSIPITTSNPDTEAPYVSLNDDPGAGLHKILISAQPTNPDRPNGETLVVIKYQARDDKSGLDAVSYRLLDPQGISHHEYHYHPNFYTRIFTGDATAWTEYELRVVLPKGSAPGKWGLQELIVRDKASNQRTYSFVETLHFMVAD